MPGSRNKIFVIVLIAGILLQWSSFQTDYFTKNKIYDRLDTLYVKSPKRGSDKMYSEFGSEVIALGPEAIPYLLDLVDHRETLFETAYRTLYENTPHKLKSRFPKPTSTYDRNLNQELALALIHRLKTQATPAIPVLCRLLLDRTCMQHYQVMMALGSMGSEASEALPALKGFMRNPSETGYKAYAAVTIYRINGDIQPVYQAFDEAFAGGDTTYLLHAAISLGESAGNSEEIVPRLLPLITHSDQRIRHVAARILRSRTDFATEITPEMITVVSIPYLNDPSMIGALVELGLHSDANTVDVVNALVKALGHGNSRAETITRAAEELGQFGEKAKTALTALLDAAEQSNWRTERAAALSVFKIDIETALKNKRLLVPKLIGILEGNGHHLEDKTRAMENLMIFDFIPAEALSALRNLNSAEDPGLRQLSIKAIQHFERKEDIGEAEYTEE